MRSPDERRPRDVCHRHHEGGGRLWSAESRRISPGEARHDLILSGEKLKDMTAPLGWASKVATPPPPRRDRR